MYVSMYVAPMASHTLVMGAGGFCCFFLWGEKKQWRNLLFYVWGLFFSVSDFLHCVLRACVFLSVDFFVCLFVRVVVFAFAGFVVWKTLTIYNYKTNAPSSSCDVFVCGG